MIKKYEDGSLAEEIRKDNIESEKWLRKMKAMRYKKGFFKPKVYDNQLEMYKELWEDSMRMCDRLSKQNENLMLRICDLINEEKHDKKL